MTKEFIRHSHFSVCICSLSVWPLGALQVAGVTGKRLSWSSRLPYKLLDNTTTCNGDSAHYQMSGEREREREKGGGGILMHHG